MELVWCRVEVVGIASGGTAVCEDVATVEGPVGAEQEDAQPDGTARRPPAVALDAVELDPPVPERVADLRVDALHRDERQRARHGRTPQ